MKPALMTLGRSGAVTSPHTLANLLFYYGFYSEKAQSRYFKKQVFSIQSVFFEHDKSVTDLTRGLTTELQKHYDAYFKNATVHVVSADKDPQEAHRSVDISIKILTSEGDVDLFFNLLNIDGKHLKLIEFNNTGKPVKEVTT